jgi:transcriptional regulator with XRE-family HTH domain
MATPFKKVRDKMSPERRARVEARTQAMLAEMPLHELRRAQDLSQETIARVLGVKQSSISKIENQTDMYVSTLRSYVEAIGGNLVITAKLPSGDVPIKRFDEIRRLPEPTATKKRARSERVNVPAAIETPAGVYATAGERRKAK